MHEIYAPAPDRACILVPIAHTAAEPQLHAARDYARSLHADVLLMHVLPRPGARQEALAQAYLDTLVDHLAGECVRAQAVVRSGKLAATIVAEADAVQAAAIVLGVSRRSALLSAVAGSVSGTIAREAPCPVLLVKRPRGTESRDALWSFYAAAGRAGPLTRRQPRLQTVAVERIVGSVNRSNELDVDFRPRRGLRRKLDDQRLEGIREALQDGHGLPVVELYQLGSGYYVLDGHHRVAAALMLGQVEIDASVIEFASPGCPPSAFHGHRRSVRLSA